MPVTMGGMASGMDTDAIISKLVDVERRPILQLELDKKKYRTRKEALKVLRGHLEEIDKNAKNLYGFRASFDDKKALSSDTEIISATATKKAKEGLTSIRVDRIASNHKVSTDPVKASDKLSPASFTLSVNGESAKIRFKGGKIQTLKDRIDEEASGLVTSTLIKKSEDEYVLTLESKVSGEKGEIQITGGKDFLKTIGMVKGEKGEKQEKVALVFDKRYFTSYMGKQKIDEQDGSLSVSQDGKTVSVQGLLWQEYTLPLAAPVKKETVLEFNFAYQEQKKDEEPVPFRVEFGPEERTVIKGIELRGYNVSRLRKIEEKKKKEEFDSLLGIGVVADDKGKRVEKIYPLEKDSKGKQEIPLGRDFNEKSVSKVILYCNDGSADFTDASIMTPIKGKGILEPKNHIAKAEDAKLNVDGIDIFRDKNKGITDIIEGVSLDLNRASPKNVSIDVKLDTETAMDRIKKFVESYNQYLEYNAQLIKTEKITKPGQRGDSDRGLFVGDMTIVRIESVLRKTVNSAYPSRADRPVKMLPELGVSTGEINADWETIKQGKLVIDESKVEETIRDNPEGVKNFFGSDNDGDNRTDNGMAYNVVNILKPYTSSGKNIITSKMDLEDENIKLANERIERQEEHVKKYEEKLRAKFATMEKSISGAKSQENWLKQQSGGGQNDK
ncbi:MAG TPA: flagellar filament capping protein FliD [Spirochaetota bacterium]|nr:flagellar filament capping protein FliD [Spirochaetota bacterium]HPI88735.1 flagellar filament capping protein FliD [Spirochaetota bacterium]HPR48743.1 flagellar filament capping protein FliD [Spirochaetota bacterium]